MTVAAVTRVRHAAQFFSLLRSVVSGGGLKRAILRYSLHNVPFGRLLHPPVILVCKLPPEAMHRVGASGRRNSI